MLKIHRLIAGSLGALLAISIVPARAEREPVLKQIALPHDYYFREMYLPQLTSGPSSLAWSPDGAQLVFSMQGGLWLQDVYADNAWQLTAGPGYDYQPEWSPDGKTIVFARYLGDAVELYRLDLASGEARPLTAGGDVNLEPRWSPDGKRIAWVSTQGTGRFHIFVGAIQDGRLEGERLLPDRVSQQIRYYYSEHDHELSPAWSPDGKELLYIANPEVAYGTGNLYRRGIEASAEPILLRAEETTWKARPDWSPDGRRVIWSSYAGRQWHQLWITSSAGGGEPLPLTFGDFDVTAARWSPDGKRVAYVSNESGNTAIWIQDLVGGRKIKLLQARREYLWPAGHLDIRIVDAKGREVPARLSVTGADGRSYGPDDAWLHADDGFDRARQKFETHYFHSGGASQLTLPEGEARVTVWRGLEHEIERRTLPVEAGKSQAATIETRPLDLPEGWAQRWSSGDVHVHMNYGGAYRNTPARMVAQAAAEDLDVVFNLVVNKEQRIPDIGYFSTEPDGASNDQVLLLHAQEFHTGYWGHLGLLGLRQHLLLPDFSGYPNTGLASPFPDNATVADLARGQGALVGYVHPYDDAPDPHKDGRLTSALPIDVALGKVDYYEVSGFSHYGETQKVWYRLLNCGFRVTAAGGTDAMANYASLRGPVGLNRVYVQDDPAADNGPVDAAAQRDRWLQGLKAGRTLATNGPLLGFAVEGVGPGGELKLPPGTHQLTVRGFLRSIVPVDHLEIVFNGEVLSTITADQAARSADIGGVVEVDRSGWLVLRAWNDETDPDVFDRWPYATTNPVFVQVGNKPVRSREDAEYFLSWIRRVREYTAASDEYNTEAEKQAVLRNIDAARAEFEKRR